MLAAACSTEKLMISPLCAGSATQATPKSHRIFSSLFLFLANIFAPQRMNVLLTFFFTSSCASGVGCLAVKKTEYK